MTRSPVEQQIRHRITEHGRITFAEFMQICLYSRDGGFYASRAHAISRHFGTSAMSHPVFGALIARQLEQMWHLLGDPPVFHVIEVGSGDGALARSIARACARTAPEFAQALCYVATDYAPRWLHYSDHAADWENDGGNRRSAVEVHAVSSIRRVHADGLHAFRHATGCILSNELIDNLPVHRFAIEGGSVKEAFVTLVDDNFTEVLDEPSAGIEQRLADLGLPLADGYRGEVNLALEDWTDQVVGTLDRGFVLTIDYGELAAELYASENRDGTLVCYRRHAASSDPLEKVGEQDITCQVDFTSLARLGERRRLATLGYSTQREFLMNLGFPSFLDALERQDMSSARASLNRIAMMALVDPEQYGELKVLVQAKGLGPEIELVGVARTG